MTFLQTVGVAVPTARELLKQRALRAVAAYGVFDGPKRTLELEDSTAVESSAYGGTLFTRHVCGPAHDDEKGDKAT